MDKKQFQLMLVPLVAILFVLPILPGEAANLQPNSVELVQPIVAAETVQALLPADAVVVSEEIVGGPPPVAGVCCPAPCIIYRERGRCRKTCCSCEPPIETALTVPKPRCCNSYVEVPICLPGCCKSAPSVKCRRGLFCNGVVVYRWCCGFTVTVVFKKSGQIIVTSPRV
jgi:hypothetical protein